ncbi:MAG: hypothetical protein ACKOS8_09405, partial [Gemmataceae bacterium]
RMNPWIGLANGGILFLGSGLVALAVRSLASGDSDRATKRLIAALTAGGCFLGIEGYEIVEQFRVGFFPGKIGEVFPEGAVETKRYDEGPGRAWLDMLKPSLETLGGKEYRLITGKEKAAVPAGPAQMLDSVRRNPGKNLAYEILASIDKGEATPSGAARQVFEANEAVRFSNATADAENRFREPEIPVPPALPHGNLWATCWVVLAGLHGIHLVAAMMALGVPALAGLVGRLGPRSLAYLKNAGLFWHFVTVAWVGVFLVVYWG